MPYAILNKIRVHYDVSGQGDAVLPGGHGFFLEHADLFNRALVRFLSSVRAK